MSLSGGRWVDVSRTHWVNSCATPLSPPFHNYFTSLHSFLLLIRPWHMAVLLTVPGGMVLPTAEDLKIPTENHLLIGLNTIMSTVPVTTCHCIIYYIIFSLSTLSRLNGSCFSYYYKLFHVLSSCLPLAGCTPIKIFISDANLLK